MPCLRTNYSNVYRFPLPPPKKIQLNKIMGMIRKEGGGGGGRIEMELAHLLKKPKASDT